MQKLIIFNTYLIIDCYNTHMSIQLEALPVAEIDRLQQDLICLNKFGDRRFVFRAEDPRMPQIRRTEFQGMTLYGEWIGLMDVTEERYKGQSPLYTVGVQIISGEDEETGGTVLTSYFYSNGKSSWEEGWHTRLRSNPQTTREEMAEMQAQAMIYEQLPAVLDVEATVRTFFDQIEQSSFITPTLLSMDYEPER